MHAGKVKGSYIILHSRQGRVYIMSCIDITSYHFIIIQYILLMSNIVSIRITIKIFIDITIGRKIACIYTFDNGREGKA